MHNIESKSNIAPDAQSRDEYEEDNEIDMQTLTLASNEPSASFQTENPKNRGYKIRTNKPSKPPGEQNIEQEQTRTNTKRIYIRLRSHHLSSIKIDEIERRTHPKSGGLSGKNYNDRQWRELKES